MPETVRERLATGLAAYLSPRLGAAGELPAVTIAGLFRIPGGASRETWSFDACWRTEREERRQGLILRRDPDAGLLDSDRDLEYRVYRAFQGSDVPVPRVHWLERGTQALERPFFIMERIDGCRTDGTTIAGRSTADRGRIARRKYEILAAIHRPEPAAIGLADLDPLGMPSPHECAARQLAHWERIVDAQALEPLPIVRLAISWLRSHLPPVPPRVTVCHGDFRSGNYLYDEAGIRGILDWEMVHLGDPAEDLAWSCLENWRFGGPGPTGGQSDRAGGLVPIAEAIRLYEQASGTIVDPAAFHWWHLFSHVKAVAIWITGGRAFVDGRTREPLMPLIPRLLNAVQFEGMLDLLGW